LVLAFSAEHKTGPLLLQLGAQPLRLNHLILATSESGKEQGVNLGFSAHPPGNGT